MIRFGSRVGFRSTEPQRFLRVGFRVLKNGKPRFVSGGLPGSKEWKRTKIRSGGLPKNGKSRFASEFRRTEKRELRFGRSVRMDFRQTGEPRFVRMGFGQIKESRFVRVDFGQMGELRFVRIKISSGLSEERKKTKDLVSVFRRTEKTKIRSMGFRVLKNNRKPRFVSGSLKKVEPRFVWCLGWVPMNRKKPKIHQDS
ncbi:unnamed protein product [Rhizophagus irregularis]|nr:unnamed protein product [Rhizophagus irregularis]